ncbi:DUF6414 family protein [Pseudonocardia ailaonensis]
MNDEIVPSEPNQPAPTIFREFLYADLERARSLFAQRLGGVPEEDKTTDSSMRHFAVGAKRVLGMGRESGRETYEQRSLLDALFPALEELLEAEEWLTDISDIVHDEEDEDPSTLLEVIEAGSIIRVTAYGSLFDAEYFARILGGASVAADGIAGVMKPPAEGAPQPRQKPKGQRGKPPIGDGVSRPAQLEDLVEDFPAELMGGGAVTADQFRSMIRVARGMFPSGLHLTLETDGGVGWTATARLQKGRQYLEADPDVLFSRYGTAAQEWTIVGSIGYFTESPEAPSLTEASFLGPNNQISRAAFVAGLNSMLGFVAGIGMADAPPYPGFSIIPLAVYRSIPKAAHAVAE